ncbi:MAG: FG-GAP-like repeat-containing protein, partial [Myxococcota bacterium]
KIGHYERRLAIDLGVGERFDGFVSLPRAVRSASRATGPSFELAWGGDATGDGRPEVYARTFGTMELLDPWGDRTLWELTTPDTMRTTYRFADVNGDGALDLVRAVDGAREGVAVFSALQTGRGPKPIWTRDWEAEPRGMRPPPIATADLDGDGHTDVITAVRASAEVIARSGVDGHVLWRRPVSSNVGAIDPLGADAVIAISSAALETYDADGSSRFRVAFEAPMTEFVDSMIRRGDSTLGRPLTASVDLDLDGHADALAPIQPDGSPAEIWAVSGKTGERLWAAPATKHPHASTLPRLDVTGDGVDDLLARTPDASEPSVRVLDGSSGRVLATMAGSAGLFLRGYGQPRIVTVGDATVRSFDAQGTIIGESSGHDGLVATAVAFDHDGDGRTEAAIVDRAPGVRLFDGDAQPVAFAPTFSRVSRFVREGDADGDGFADLLARADGVALLQAEQTLWQREAREGLRVSPVAVQGKAGRPNIAIFGNFGHGRALNVFEGDTGAWIGTGDKTHVIRTPVVTHVDNREVLASQSESNYFALDLSADATRLRKIPTAMGYATPAVGDVDGDGELEVLLVPWKTGSVQLLDLRTGAVRWSYDPQAGSWMQPLIVDIDGTAPREVVVGYHDGTLDVRDGGTGHRWWTASAGVQKHSFPPAFATTADGPTFFAVGTGESPELLALDATNGAIRWRAAGPRPQSGPAAADIDGDGSVEVFAGTARGVMSFTERGELRWEYQTGKATFGRRVRPSGSIVLADLDHNGRFEVVAAFGDGSARVLDAETGTLLVNVIGHGERMESPPAPVDVDGDGIDELVMAGQDHWLRCVRVPVAALSSRDAPAKDQRLPTTTLGAKRP